MEQRHEQWQKQSHPVLKVFLAWLEKESVEVTPKSTLGEAITYCLNQWSKLVIFLEDGNLELDNNQSERSIKPFVIGRMKMDLTQFCTYSAYLSGRQISTQTNWRHSLPCSHGQRRSRSHTKAQKKRIIARNIIPTTLRQG